MAEFKNNSEKKSDEKEKRVDRPIAQGKAKKKNDFQRIAGNIIADDLTNIRDNIVNEVTNIVRRSLYDIGMNMLGQLLFKGNVPGKSKSRASRISYDKYYDSYDDKPEQRRSRSGYDYDDICLDSKEEAEDVLDRMEDLISRYGDVKVADLYELVGMQTKHTDYNYGWYNLSTAKTIFTREGYLLKLPRPKPLDREER